MPVEVDSKVACSSLLQSATTVELVFQHLLVVGTMTTAKRQDGPTMRDYKYSQEISQMVSHSEIYLLRDG